MKAQIFEILYSEDPELQDPEAKLDAVEEVLLNPPSAEPNPERNERPEEAFLKAINANKEQLIQAFVAETGVKPSECKLVTSSGQTPDGRYIIETYITKKE